MEDNQSKEQQSEPSSAENQEGTTVSSTTIENNTSEENKTNPNETKIKLPKIKLPSIKLSFSGIKYIYEKHYKKLLIIPFALLLIAILSIGIQVATTGDFINRDVSLKGGVTVTIPTSEKIDVLQLKETISSRFPENDILTKSLSRFGTQVGVIVEVDIEKEQVDALIAEIGKALSMELTSNEYSIEFVGSSLGASFFKEIIRALLIAFLLMALA